MNKNIFLFLCSFGSLSELVYCSQSELKTTFNLSNDNRASAELSIIRLQASLSGEDLGANPRLQLGYLPHGNLYVRLPDTDNPIDLSIDAITPVFLWENFLSSRKALIPIANQQNFYGSIWKRLAVGGGMGVAGAFVAGINPISTLFTQMGIVNFIAVPIVMSFLIGECFQMVSRWDAQKSIKKFNRITNEHRELNVRESFEAYVDRFVAACQQAKIVSLKTEKEEKEIEALTAQRNAQIQANKLALESLDALITSNRLALSNKIKKEDLNPNKWKDLFRQRVQKKIKEKGRRKRKRSLDISSRSTTPSPTSPLTPSSRLFHRSFVSSPEPRREHLSLQPRLINQNKSNVQPTTPSTRVSPPPLLASDNSSGIQGCTSPDVVPFTIMQPLTSSSSASASSSSPASSSALPLISAPLFGSSFPFPTYPISFQNIAAKPHCSPSGYKSSGESTSSMIAKHLPGYSSSKEPTRSSTNLPQRAINQVKCTKCDKEVTGSSAVAQNRICGACTSQDGNGAQTLARSYQQANSDFGDYSN